jgi:hypothetical protein
MKGRAPSHADPSYYNKNKLPVLWNTTAIIAAVALRIIVKSAE